MVAFLRMLSAAVWSGLAFSLSVQAEPAGLARESPFLPTGIPALAAGSGEAYELAGISTMGRQTSVNIYDKIGKKGLWIAVGETASGITVSKYDSARELVVIRVAGTEKILALRKAASSTARPGAIPPPPVAAGFNIPPPPTVVPVALAPAPLTAAGASPAPAAPRPAPPVPGSVAHQEQEARMLVSDLLEIGMAQRKAYEEAQKKATQSGGDSTPADPNATATPPAAPPHPAAN
jgi:hypothetical protein